ncbi:MAG: glycerol-3-phosphate acyltransferase, partial [Spirochaetia bacterium]|nr:glycerol-3-phosphate acyltransferase [Spirochaetia bacterium]
MVIEDQAGLRGDLLLHAFRGKRSCRGIDIRRHGSGNVGATNTFRVLGKGPGIFVLVCDIESVGLAIVNHEF